MVAPRSSKSHFGSFREQMFCSFAMDMPAQDVQSATQQEALHIPMAMSGSKPLSAIRPHISLAGVPAGSMLRMGVRSISTSQKLLPATQSVPSAHDNRLEVLRTLVEPSALPPPDRAKSLNVS